MEVLGHVNLFSVTLRLILSLILGGLLGWEREQKGHPAGFRTYMLVCMGSTLVMLTSQYVIETFHTGDIFRMGAQVVSGIGFLGAGTIIVTGRKQVKGLTTAAGIWAAACLGLAIGIGFYWGAVIGCGLMFVVLSGFHILEKRISCHSRVLNLFFKMESMNDFGTFLRVSKENFLKVSNVEISHNKKENSEIVILLSVSWQGERSHESVLHILEAIPGVTYMEEY